MILCVIQKTKVDNVPFALGAFASHGESSGAGPLQKSLSRSLRLPDYMPLSQNGNCVCFTSDESGGTVSHCRSSV